MVFKMHVFLVFLFKFMYGLGDIITFIKYKQTKIINNRIAYLTHHLTSKLN